MDRGQIEGMTNVIQFPTRPKKTDPFADKLRSKAVDLYNMSVVLAQRNSATHSERLRLASISLMVLADEAEEKGVAQ